MSSTVGLESWVGTLALARARVRRAVGYSGGPLPHADASAQFKQRVELRLQARQSAIRSGISRTNISMMSVISGSSAKRLRLGRPGAGSLPSRRSPSRPPELTAGLSLSGMADLRNGGSAFGGGELTRARPRR